MAITLNRKAYDHARELIEQGRTAKDEDSWGEHAPTAERQNTYLEHHGWDEYALWFLGIDRDEPEETKGRYSFPIGDFTRIHRDGVIAAEARAAQFDHDEVARAAKRLLDLMDR